ncbi:phosphatidic acid phosphatase type 2/haloperoxidase [Roridomyces roridus]|uniref:Phosphatidic acid phosphatase type 2/haloperoxidase n=1 Tax=Roridomyces roridus TaxID=1738132 RepID=A0AAD7CIX2_9AGAR|nr:phosphatidic acid phosphatase type 2/haloperoxidase [Roridomyces roridus]
MPNKVLARGLRILQSYGVDWILAVLVALFANFFLDRFQNMPDFDLNDTSIQHAFKAKEVFPNSTLVFILLFSYVLLVASNLIISRNMWDLHHALLGLTVTFAFSGTFVEVVRISVGRPRPDFISRCNPFANATNGLFFGLANITDVCQTPISDPLIKDGVRSFFSGHAILSAAGLGYNSLYWAGKFHLFNHRSYSSKAWLVFSPLMVSIYICITRVTDHRHHPSDAVTGFFVGLLFTYIFYRQFYPSLEDPHCDLPFAPRFSSEENSRSGQGWGPGRWFSVPDEQPVPLLPTHRGANASPSHASVEADLESNGLIATPFDHDPETEYSGMPAKDPHGSEY